jgi:hypothetical protein
LSFFERGSIRAGRERGQGASPPGTSEDEEKQGGGMRTEDGGPSKGERKEEREKRKERAKEPCAACCVLCAAEKQKNRGKGEMRKVKGGDQ